MYCTKCGAQLSNNDTLCTSCGTSIPVKESHKTISLLSMIFGLVALGTQVTGVSSGISLPAAIAAVVCGFIARSQAEKAGKSDPNAQAGIICGFITIGINVVYSILAIIFLIFYFVFVFGILGMSMGAGMYM